MGEKIPLKTIEITGFQETIHKVGFFNLMMYTQTNSRWIKELTFKNELKELNRNVGDCFYNSEVGEGLPSMSIGAEITQGNI